ncbi:hypothetical protein MOPEL_001_00680 [Mobilicoccus pelagius NBRC 104925]|uniref:SGNH hydrolase-type esterase domain-containing protein n=2 Tax=Mobilicoccus TaxID=984996 RepID=H5UMJ2_9MICO|nr:hypothetical protein MOPEL_001_00680 [Mobilicoccus pelagius NBRC 104925]
MPAPDPTERVTRHESPAVLRHAAGLLPDLPRAAAFALAPVLAVQGARTLARVPRLPEAGGDRTGLVGDDHDDAVTVLVVGESTAVGVGVDTQEEGMAATLARRLHETTGESVRWSVVGRNGARLRATARRRLSGAFGEYDCAVVVLGVNDTLGLTSTRRWRREVETLLTALRRGLRDDGLVVLAGVPQLRHFPALPQPLRTVMGLHGRALDDVLTRIADDNPDVVHIPTPAMEDRADLAADGFHPSACGYRRWGDLIADAALLPWRRGGVEGS